MANSKTTQPPTYANVPGNSKIYHTYFSGPGQLEEPPEYDYCRPTELIQNGDKVTDYYTTPYTVDSVPMQPVNTQEQQDRQQDKQVQRTVQKSATPFRIFCCAVVAIIIVVVACGFGGLGYYLLGQGEQGSDSRWSDWNEWNSCIATVDECQRYRNRECRSTNDNCQGEGQENMNCDIKACAEWTAWEAWSTCSDLFLQVRNRRCLSGIYEMAGCDGDSSESSCCNNNSCPEWTAWSPWSICSKSCCSGDQTRNRTCMSGGYEVSGCAGSDSQMEACNTQECPEWSSWGQWQGLCSCCGDTQSRIRSCQLVSCSSSRPSASLSDQCGGDSTETRDCTCPAWTNWGQCQQKNQIRERTCTKPTGCVVIQPCSYFTSDKESCAPTQ